MTIEEKAQRYDETLEQLKGLIEVTREDKCDITEEDIINIFPELKESEDERIRKQIISFLKEFECDHYRNLDFSSWIAWLEKQGEPEDKGEISDGYHTFNELYYYRMLYNAAFFNLLPKECVHKSKRHHDGEECFGGGWFIVMAKLPTGQISNHYELKDWDLFQIPEKEIADKWDGHTPQEAAKRLHEYLLESKIEQKPALWSKEDERIHQCLIRDQEEALDDVRNDKYGHSEIISDLKEMYRERIDWLKSLKQRIKK